MNPGLRIDPNSSASPLSLNPCDSPCTTVCGGLDPAETKPNFPIPPLVMEIEGRLLSVLPLCIPDLQTAYESGHDQAPKGLLRIDLVDFFQRLLERHRLNAEEPTATPVVEITRDSTYYMDSVILEVEGELFVVPRHHLLGSTIFNSVEHENLAPDDPIKLDDVRRSDFKALMQFFFPPFQTALTLSQWVSVLRLSTKWRLLEARTAAISQLNATSMAPKALIRCGRQFKVIDWLRSGYIALAQREAALTVDEFHFLGTQTALDLSQKIRRPNQRYLNRNRKSARPSSSNVVGHDTSDVIRHTFSTELANQVCILDTVARILLGRQHGIPQLIESGYVDLLEREEDFGVEEVEALGLETVVMLCGIREGVGSSKLSFDLEKEMDRVFEKELDEIRTAAADLDDVAKEESKATNTGGTS